VLCLCLWLLSNHDSCIVNMSYVVHCLFFDGVTLSEAMMSTVQLNNSTFLHCHVTLPLGVWARGLYGLDGEADVKQILLSQHWSSTEDLLGDRASPDSETLELYRRPPR